MDWVMPNPDIRIWVLDYPRRLTDELTTSDLHNFLSICENQRWSMESSVKLNSLWGWLTRFHENGGLIVLFLVNHPHDCCTKSQCFMMNLQSFADVLRSFGHQAPLWITSESSQVFYFTGEGKRTTFSSPYGEPLLRFVGFHCGLWTYWYCGQCGTAHAVPTVTENVSALWTYW